MVASYDFTGPRALVDGKTEVHTIWYLPATARITAVTNTTNPTITTSTPHGLAAAGRVRVAGVTGAEGVNGGWLVLAVPDARSFTLTMPAPGVYTGGGRAGMPIDTTGYTARLHVRDAADTAATLLTLTSEDGGLMLGGADGSIVIRFSKSATAPLSVTWRRAVYELELIAASGAVLPVAAGTIAVRSGVAR